MTHTLLTYLKSYSPRLAIDMLAKLHVRCYFGVHAAIHIHLESNFEAGNTGWLRRGEHQISCYFRDLPNYTILL
jgi:hypothetical protein